MADSLLDNYNPLYDVHLQQYFTLPHMQKHLRRMGLIAPSQGDDDYARHYVMVDMMLKNREVQLMKMYELRKKLDAAQKVETCRRIRSGQSPVTHHRVKPSRSLSRGRQSTSGKKRRSSSSTDHNEIVEKIEEEHSQPVEYNPKDPYSRLSATVQRFQYLHRLDDSTLNVYKENLKKQLQRLERFRDVSFGVHSVARQPPTLHQSWFFRRRSYNTVRGRSRQSSRSAKPNQSNESRTSRTSCPPTTNRRRKDSNGKLPSIVNPRMAKTSPPQIPLPNLQQSRPPARGRSATKKPPTSKTTQKVQSIPGSSSLPQIKGLSNKNAAVAKGAQSMPAELAPESSSNAKMETTTSTEHIQGPVFTSTDESLHAPEAVEAQHQYEDHPADERTPIQKHDDDGSVGSGSYIEGKGEEETAEVKESPVTEERSLREKRSPSEESPTQGMDQDEAHDSQLREKRSPSVEAPIQGMDQDEAHDSQLREKRSLSVEAPIQGMEQDEAHDSQLQPSDEKPEEHVDHQRDSTTPGAEAVSDARADTSDDEQEHFTRKEAVSAEVSHEPHTQENDEGHGHDDSMSVKSEARNIIDQDRELDVTTDHVSVLVSPQPQPSEHMEQRDLAPQQGLTEEHDHWDAHQEQHSEAKQQHEAAHQEQHSKEQEQQEAETALTDDYDHWAAHQEQHSEAEQQHGAAHQEQHSETEQQHEAATAVPADDYDRWSAHQEQHSEAEHQHGAATAFTDDHDRWTAHQEQHSGTEQQHEAATAITDDYDRWEAQQEQHPEAQQEMTNDLSEDYDRWAAQQEQHPEAQQDAGNDLNDDYDRWAEQQERHSEAHQDSADHLKDDYDHSAEQQEQHSDVHEDAAGDLRGDHDRWTEQQEQHSEAHQDSADHLKDDYDRWTEQQEQHSEAQEDAAGDLRGDHDRWAEQQEQHSEAHQDSADHLKDDYDRWTEQQEQHSEAQEDAAGDLKDDHDRWIEHREQHSEVLQEATLRRTDEEHEGRVEHVSDDRKDDDVEVHEYLQKASPIQAEYEQQHRDEASAEQLHRHSLSSSGSSSPVRSFPESVTDETEEKTELHREIHHESATENYPASRGSNNDDYLQRQEENFSNRNEFSGRKDENGSENENKNKERDSFPANGEQMYRDDSTSHRQVEDKHTSRTTIQDDDSSTDSMVIHDDVEKSSDVLRSPNVTASHSETDDHLDSTPVHGVDGVQKNDDVTSYDRHSNEDFVTEGEHHSPLERSSEGSRELLHTSNNGHSATPDVHVMTSDDVISASEAEKSPGSVVVQSEHELDDTRAASETDTRLTGDHAPSPSSDVHYPEGGTNSPMQGGYDYSSAHSNENGKDEQLRDVGHTWTEHPLTSEKHTIDDGVMSTDSMVAHDDVDSSDADHSGGDFMVHSVTEQSSNNRSMYYHGNGHEADDDTAYGYSRSESEPKFSQPEDFERKSDSERHFEESSTHRADFYNWQGESGEITADYGMESKPEPEAHKTPSTKGETMGNDDLYAITSEASDIFDQLKPSPNDSMRVPNKGHGVAASDEENNNDDGNTSEDSSDDERTKLLSSTKRIMDDNNLVERV